MRRAARWAAALVVGIASLAFASLAHGYVYWADSTDGAGAIGRANLDGTGIDHDFITGAGDPCGIAVTGQHIYWANREANAIGRANLDGTGVDPDFIVNDETVAGFPCAPTVGGGRIWWTNFLSDPGEGTIARANLDGSDAQTAFFTGSSVAGPIGVALTPDRVIWANTDINGASPRTSSIGSAGFDGTPPPVRDFVPFGETIAPTWLVANATHFYAEITVSGLAGFAVARFEVDGTPAVTDELERIDGTGGLALLGGRLYFADARQGTIGRASLDGSSPDFAYIRTGDPLNGIAVDGRIPPNDFALGKVKTNRRKGTAKLAVDPVSPGTVALSGRGVKPQSVPTNGSPVTLTVKPNGAAARKLRKTGKAKVKPQVTFSPTGGVARSESRKVKLVRRK